MNQFKHAKWWRSYLDKPTKEEKQRKAKRSKEKQKRSKEKQRGKQRTAAAVFFGTFGALPEVHFLHAIYRFKAQEVKNPTLQTVYDLELKRGRYGLRKTTAPGVRKVCEWCAKLAHPLSCANGVRNSHTIRTPHAWCEISSVFADSTLDIFLSIFWCNFLSSPCIKPMKSFAFVKTI